MRIVFQGLFEIGAITDTVRKTDSVVLEQSLELGVGPNARSVVSSDQDLVELFEESFVERGSCLSISGGVVQSLNGSAL